MQFLKLVASLTVKENAFSMENGKQGLAYKFVSGLAVFVARIGATPISMQLDFSHNSSWLQYPELDCVTLLFLQLGFAYPDDRRCQSKIAPDLV